MSSKEGRDRIGVGIDRVLAVRDAIGPDVVLLVDCHGRLHPKMAVTICAQLADCRLGWLEDPVPSDDIDGWRTLRRATDLLLAGGEAVTSARALLRVIQDTGIDVAMPDIKLCGGVTGMRACATVASTTRTLLAPHNPSGPVSTLMTAHACAAASVYYVETAWNDTPKPNILPIVSRQGRVIVTDPAPGINWLPADGALPLSPAIAERLGESVGYC